MTGFLLSYRPFHRFFKGNCGGYFTSPALITFGDAWNLVVNEIIIISVFDVQARRELNG